jgi:hypothetical protein
MVAQWVSARDEHRLDDDVKMLREAVSNGMWEKGEQGIYPGSVPHGDSIADPCEFIRK